MFEIIENAFWLTQKNRKMLFLTYALNLLFGLIVAVFFYEILAKEATGSIILDKLIADFDYMVFSDFMRIHGSAFTPVLIVALVIGGLYILINALLVGGIFQQYSYGRDANFRFTEFWKSGVSLFGKYILVSIIVFSIGLVLILLAVFLFVLFAKFAEGGNERTYFFWMITPLFLLALMLSILMTISDYTRFLLFENRTLNPVSGFGKGASYVFKHFTTVGLYWFIIVMSLAVVLAYLLIEAAIGMRSEVTIFLMVVFQQVSVLGRVFIKNWNFALIHSFYTNNPILINNDTIIMPNNDDDKLSEVD